MKRLRILFKKKTPGIIPGVGLLSSTDFSL